MNSIKVLKSLSEPLRLRILHLLQQSPLTVGELVEILAQSQSNVSHHLKMLSELKLIQSTKKGNINLYSSFENPKLTATVLHLFKNIATLVEELAEAKHDQQSLLHILEKRKKKGLPEDWTAWRKLQPDLPYTYQFALLGKTKQGVAIDAGCGDGNFSHILKNHFSTVIAYDNNLRQLKKAQESITNVSTLLTLAHAEDLPVKSKTIDAIFFRMVLQFVEHPEKAISEAIRVIKPSARISIIDRTEGDNLRVNFSSEYFQRLSQKHRDIRLISYETHPGIFLCCLEKANISSSR